MREVITGNSDMLLSSSTSILAGLYPLFLNQIENLRFNPQRESRKIEKRGRIKNNPTSDPSSGDRGISGHLKNNFKYIIFACF